MFNNVHQSFFLVRHFQNTERATYANKTRYLWIQAAEQAWYACAHQTCLMRLSKRTKHRPSNTTTKEMFRVVWSNVWWPSNFIKHEQTRSNSTKQCGQTIKCLVTKQCPTVSSRQTSPARTGLYHLEESKSSIIKFMAELIGQANLVIN